LLSIQSLMSPNPFENEPGFESAQDDRAKKLQKAYVQKVKANGLYTIGSAVLTAGRYNTKPFVYPSSRDWKAI
jgi:hypothetical protein